MAKKKPEATGSAFLLSACAVAVFAVVLARQFAWLRQGNGLALLICGAFLLTLVVADMVARALAGRNWGIALLLFVLVELVALTKVGLELWLLARAI